MPPDEDKTATEEESTFQIDDEPLIPKEEIKACSIQDPDCEACQ